MTEQLSLLTATVPSRLHETLEERWSRFAAANKHVYELIVAIARELRDNGATRVSMKFVFETIRVRQSVYIKSNEPWRLDNSFTSFYAREVRRREPDLAALFEVRRRSEAA